jgi:hypothetical protein
MKKIRIILLINILLLTASIQQIFASDSQDEKLRKLCSDSLVIDTNVTVDLPGVYEIKCDSLLSYNSLVGKNKSDLIFLENVYLLFVGTYVCKSNQMFTELIFDEQQKIYNKPILFKRKDVFITLQEPSNT